MAAPIKRGFQYYSVDTDRYEDIRIRRLVKDNGGAGLAVYDYILSEIYRGEGCFLSWGDSSAFDVADFFGMKESKVEVIVQYCAAVGLFDKELLGCGIVTSRSIQERYIAMCKRAKRSEFSIPPKICLIGNISGSNEVSSGNNGVSSGNNDKFRKERGFFRKESSSLRNISGSNGVSSGSNGVSSGSNSTYSIKEISLTNAHTREGELLPLDDCFESLCKNDLWAESALMSIRADGFTQVTSLEDFLQRFRLKLRADGEEYKSVQDAKKHFVSWVKQELKREYEANKRNHSGSKKQDANEYALRKTAERITGMESEVSDPF